MTSEKKQLTQIGIIGDVHAESTRLFETIQFLHRLGLETIVCVGDIVDGPEDVDECSRLLRENNVITVLGNHDQWFLENQLRNLPEATLWGQVRPETEAYLSILPPTVHLRSVMGGILLCHGIGDNNMRRLTPDDYGYAIDMNFELQDLIHSQQYRFLINGHTHRRMVRSFGDLTVINAGTLKRVHQPCFCVADFEGQTVQFYEFDEGLNICESSRHTL